MRMGDNCVGTLGTSITDPQIKLLSRFKQVFVMFDDGEEEAIKKAKSLASRVSILGSRVEIITNYADGRDPGDLMDDEVKNIKKELGFVV